MLDFVEHPRVLIGSVLLCVPMLFPLAQYFFEDFNTFKNDLGLNNSVGSFAWLIGWPLEEYTLRFRIIGFFGCYAGVVAAVYHLIVHVGRL